MPVAQRGSALPRAAVRRGWGLQGKEERGTYGVARGHVDHQSPIAEHPEPTRALPCDIGVDAEIRQHEGPAAGGGPCLPAQQGPVGLGLGLCLAHHTQGRRNDHEPDA